MNPAATGADLYRQVDHYITYYNNRYHQGIKAKSNALSGQESTSLALAS